MVAIFILNGAMTHLLKIIIQSNRIFSFAILIILLLGCSDKTSTTDKSQSDTGQGIASNTVEREFYSVHCESFRSLSIHEKRYAYHLRKACSLSLRKSIISELELARQFASIQDNIALEELIDYLQTGNEISLRWYKEARKKHFCPVVNFDFIVPESIDTSSATVSLRGLVLIRDMEFNRKLNSVGIDTSGLMNYYSFDGKIDGEKIKSDIIPQAFELLYASEIEGRLFHKDNTKNSLAVSPYYVNTDFGLCYLTNLKFEDTFQIILNEFLFDEQVREGAMQTVRETRLARLLIGEINGGNVAEQLEFETQDLRTEILKSLSSLLFTHDRSLLNNNEYNPDIKPENVYSFFLTDVLASVAELLDDQFQPQAKHIIASRMIRDKAAEIVDIENKKYLIVKDWEGCWYALRNLFNELAIYRVYTYEECMVFENYILRRPGTYEILTADSLPNRTIIAENFDQEKEEQSCRDIFAPLIPEIKARVRALSLPDKRQFLWPRLNVVSNRMGGVMDVMISQPGEIDNKNSKSHADDLLKRKFISKHSQSGR